MFIRKKFKTDSKTNKQYYSYQLVESIRTINGPRQKILLSIGLNADLSKVNQKMVALRVKEIMGGYHEIILPFPKEVEHFAQLFAKQLIAKQSQDVPPSSKKKQSTHNKDFETVDLNSFTHSNCRTVGLEHITLETIRKLKIDIKLRELGFSEREVEIALGVLIGRLVKPGSERATHGWMKNQTALSELIDCNFNRISLNKVYKISDRLLQKKSDIEKHLAKTEDDLFFLDNTIAFFDITNTYLEGTGAQSTKSKRGKSKEKRFDCPLVALGMVINSDGFPRRSEIYEGNISEPSTLQKILNELRESNQTHLPVIVLDAGIASKENLKWLREEGFPYIVCARSKTEPPANLKENYDFIQKKGANTVRASLVQSDDETGEVCLFCHSTGREEKEMAIKNHHQVRFEEELKAVEAGLNNKGCTKNYKKVIEKIGRLKERYSKVSRFYKIDVVKEENGENADKIISICNSESMVDTYSGHYCLKSWGLDWKAERLWKTYMMLTKVEDGFRALKSDLGMRPIFHQKEDRIDGHLFITLLAYHILQSVLYQLDLKNVHLRWQTLRDIMSTQTRVTTSLENDKNEVVHVRSSTVAEPEQREIYEALGLSHSPGRRSKSVVKAKS